MFVCDVVQAQGSISKCLCVCGIEVSWKTETLLSLHVFWTAGSIALIDLGGELRGGGSLRMQTKLLWVSNLRSSSQ